MVRSSAAWLDGGIVGSEASGVVLVNKNTS